MRRRCTSPPTWVRTRSGASRPCAQALAERDVTLVGHPGVAAVDDLAEVRTQAGSPTRCSRPSSATGARRPAARSSGPRARCPRCPRRSRKGRLPTLDALGLGQEVEAPPPGGESGRARAPLALPGATTSRLRRQSRRPGEDRTSRLSPYLHFGCVSVREIEERLPRGRGPEAFHRQLCWRDFYHHVMLHFPRNARSEFQERYRGKIGWSHAEGASRRGARGARASRWWTPACASCAARAGCTTGRGSWWGRS